MTPLREKMIDIMTVRNLAANSCRLQLNGIRFFFRNVLNRPAYKLLLHYPKRPLRIPDLLTRNEALSLVNTPENLKHRTQLQVCYGCGLRVSEVVAFRVKDIDSERGQL
jgi:integrase/recombinase XerD